MVQNIVINAEFLIEDLKKSIIVKGDFHKNIVKAWKENIRFCVENGNDEHEQVYDFNDKQDLIECIGLGMDAEEIAYLVNSYRDNQDNTSYFNYCNNNNMYGLHILCKQDVFNQIDSSIEEIAYNILKYPYKDAYVELYREFIVPMIDNQI